MCSPSGFRGWALSYWISVKAKSSVNRFPGSLAEPGTGFDPTQGKYKPNRMASFPSAILIFGKRGQLFHLAGKRRGADEKSASDGALNWKSPDSSPSRIIENAFDHRPVIVRAAAGKEYGKSIIM